MYACIAISENEIENLCFRFKVPWTEGPQGCIALAISKLDPTGSPVLTPETSPSATNEEDTGVVQVLKDIDRLIKAQY